jgi:hypothetical protein
VVDTVRIEANATVHQDMTIETGTETGTTEIVTGIATGIAMEEADGTIDVSRLERDIVVPPEIMMTIRDVLPIMKMTVAGTSVVNAMKIVVASEEEEEAEEAEVLLAKTHGTGIVVDVANRTRMA